MPPLLKQGFPNIVKGLGARDQKSYWGWIFYWVVGTVILTIWTFFKAKSNFLKYWISNKIKISMTLCVQSVYMKLKRVQEQRLQLKMKFLLGTNMKNCYLAGKIKTFCGGSLLVRIFPGAWLSKFSACRGSSLL